MEDRYVLYTLYRRYYRTALLCLCRLSFAAFYVPVLEATNRWRCHRHVIKGSELSRQIEKGPKIQSLSMIVLRVY